MMKFNQRFLPYAVAIGSTAIALLLTLGLEPFLHRTIGAFFYIAIILMAWYGGWRLGIVTVVLSTGAIHYWFIPPPYQLGFERPEDILQLGFFLLVSLLINLLTSNFRDSKQKIERLSQQLAQKSTEQLRMALSAAQMGLWDWNILTGEIYWSPEHERLFGLAHGTFDGKYETFEARLHLEDREKLNQAVERSLKERVPYQQEFRVVWPDGSIHWIEGRGQAFYDGSGQPVRMTGTVMAIDERKQTQTRLQEREVTLRLFVQYAPASIVMFDQDMRYLTASQRWVDDYNLGSVESLIHRSHYEIFPEIPERWRQIHQRCLAGAIEKCDDDLFVRADGREQWISWEIHPWYTATDEIGGIILFSVDVSQRKQAEMALQQLNAELEQRVAARTAELAQVNDHLLETVMEQQHTQLILLEQAQLLDLAHDTIMTRDLNAVITFWNQGAEFMYGWTKAEAFGQESHTFLHTQFPKPLAEIELEFRERGYWEGELIHSRKDGSTVVVASRWVMQKDERGRPVKVLEINNDITAQKQAKVALQKYVREVEDLYNNAPCGYHSLDASGNIIRINDTELNWLGYSRDEALHRKFSEFLTAKGQQVFQENFPKFKQHGWINNLEFELITKGGATRWVSLNATAIKDESGNFLMSRSTMFDISERQAALRERKRAEEILQQYERIISNTKDGIALMNHHYIYQVANQGYLSWCNKSAHEVIGNSVRNILGQELFDNFIQPRLEQCFAGETIQYERWFDSPNLVPQFLSVTYTPYRDASENISGVIVSLRDLTQLKQAEQMLELQAVITRNIAEGICLVRADNGLIVYTNPKFEQMFGYEVGELNGQHVSIVNYATEEVTAEDVSEVIMSAILQYGEATYEVHNVKKDGTPFWCKATTSLFKHPEYGDVLVAVQQDITGAKHLEAVRQQDEKELRQSEAKFRSLSQCSPVGIFMTDIHGQCIYTNPRYQMICGCTFDEALGEGWVKFLHPEDREIVTTEWSKAVSQRQEFSGEIRYVHKDGIIRFSHVRSAPILSVSDELIGYVGTVEDITERQAVEQMKSEFISVVSHELRTPLSSIRGSLGLLAAGIFKNKPDAAQQMLDIATHDTERLVRLVNDILDLERLEAQKVHLNQQWCDATTLMGDSVKTLQSLARESQILLSVKPTSVQVFADRDRIIQTLVNLVSNAIKFSPPKSTITLRVEDQADQVLFQVKDQGRGIPTDKLETIFGRFQQVDASDSRQKGGTGLGLAICKSIVHQHGGKIWAESVVGAGSCFCFTLPKLLD